MARESLWERAMLRAWETLPGRLRRSAAGRFLRAGYRLGQALRDHPAFPGNASRITIPHLEIHITHKCNLTCEGCLHFTNHRHTGTLSLEEIRRTMGLWNKRLLPMRFALLGGEPCMHRDLVEIVYLAKEMWPHPRTRLEVVTNGLLLHLHPRLALALAQTGTTLCISRHSDDSISAKYQEKYSRGLELARTWEREYGIEAIIDDSRAEWSRGYQGVGREVMPFEDNDPQKSWAHCVTGQECFQLFEDRLWKCAPLAYLKLQAGKYDLSEKWAPYLRYQPLSPECSDRDIVAFFKRGAESVCGMCPANPQKFTKPNPLLPLRFYNSVPEELSRRPADPRDLGVVEAQ